MEGLNRPPQGAWHTYIMSEIRDVFGFLQGFFDSDKKYFNEFTKRLLRRSVTIHNLNQRPLSYHTHMCS